MEPRIDRLQRKTAENPGILAFGGGLPSPSLFPRSALAEAFIQALSEPSCPALQYGWPEGDRELRGWIAARLIERGAEVGEDDVIVTNGAQQAIAIAVEELVARGKTVAVDAETYPSALDLFRARGVTAVVGGEADWIYAMPGIANPRGNGMSAAARAALLERGLPLIADEAYAELRFDGRLDRPLLADARDRTWHIGTLSKTLSPGLRVGWLVPPPSAREAVVASKRDRDLQAGSLAQAVARAFVAAHDFDARLARARRFYEGRAERLARAIRRRLPSWRFDEPEGGFSLFLESDLEGDDAAFLELAAEHGVGFDPGCLFRPSGASSPISLRICFSSAASMGELDEAARRLERAAAAFSRSRAAGR